ncbi:MAG: PspA/IM30 family protein [Anaerolineae bacterium]|nr:MAG: PspA/IM30 family protein [Anaerolineae bacterium]
MHLGKRIGLLIRANLDRWRRRDKEAIEATLRRADKTEALLEQLGQRLNRPLVRQAKLESQLREAERMARQWDHRADESVRAGDEAAAREAVRQKLAYTQVARDLGASLAREAAAIGELQSELAKLESRLARIRAKSRVPSPATTESRTTTAEATMPASTPAPDALAVAEESVGDLDTLQERMSRVWSDEEIENELDAIKSRLSAGRSSVDG